MAGSSYCLFEGNTAKMSVTYLLIPAGGAIAAILAVTKFHLKGRDLSQYDKDNPVVFETDYNSQGQQDLRARLTEMKAIAAAGPKSRKAQLEANRARVNQIGLDREFDATFVDDTVDIDGIQVPGQWTLVEGHDPDRRLLYLHGGAFAMGSPLSHRPLTYNLAKRTGCAVFAPDYRLVPEHRRVDCVEDSCASYRWLLENGPNGPAPLKSLAVAGDSAGGNLALVVSNYIRDEGIRAPEAVIALSPGTDTTFESPSIKRNVESDMMLGPFLAPFLKMPRSVLLWVSWMTNRLTPKAPILSPLRADLTNLPPTLIQVTTSEMMYDDAARYVNKAQAAGSPAVLQSWDHVCHVWQIFDEILPEAGHALDEIGKFMKDHGATAI